MAATIDQMCDALDRALAELYRLHHRYRLKQDSQATIEVERALARFNKDVMRRRYRRASRRPAP